jgi:hypothetical protein
MAALSTLKRMVRLCGWVALSSGAMVAAACGAMFNAGCSSSTRTLRATPDAANSPDAGTGADAGASPDADAGQGFVIPDPPARDAASGEANTVDADRADLWNVICE